MKVDALIMEKAFRLLLKSFRIDKQCKYISFPAAWNLLLCINSIYNNIKTIKLILSYSRSILMSRDTDEPKK